MILSAPPLKLFSDRNGFDKGGKKTRASFDFDHRGVRLTDRQLISADCDLDRIAQGRDLTHVYLDPLGDAHIHDAALVRALTVQLLDLRR